MKLEIIENIGTNHQSAIVAALNRHFARIKQANPRGILDQFETQLSILSIEVAQELGGVVEELPDDVVRFNFTPISTSPSRKFVGD